MTTQPEIRPMALPLSVILFGVPCLLFFALQRWVVPSMAAAGVPHVVSFLVLSSPHLLFFFGGDRLLVSPYVSTMNGIQTGRMGDLPATGREFSLVNIIIQRLERGKIVETWVSRDNVASLSQLGLMQPPG